MVSLKKAAGDRRIWKERWPSTNEGSGVGSGDRGQMNFLLRGHPAWACSLIAPRRKKRALVGERLPEVKLKRHPGGHRFPVACRTRQIGANEHHVGKPLEVGQLRNVGRDSARARRKRQSPSGSCAF